MSSDDEDLNEEVEEEEAEEVTDLSNRYIHIKVTSSRTKVATSLEPCYAKVFCSLPFWFFVLYRYSISFSVMFAPNTKKHPKL